MPEMKTLFLAIGLVLLAAPKAWSTPDFGKESKDVAGKWYLLALVVEGKNGDEKKVETATPFNLTVLKGGDLEVKGISLISGQCHAYIHTLKKAEGPGKYTAFGGKIMVTILPSNTKGCYMLYYESKNLAKKIRIAKLLSRHPEKNEGALEEFRKKAKELKFTSNVFVPKQRETCSPKTD